jgi:hypothetical protein
MLKEIWYICMMMWLSRPITASIGIRVWCFTEGQIFDTRTAASQPVELSVEFTWLLFRGVFAG